MMARSAVRHGDWRISYSSKGQGPALVLLHGGLPSASGDGNFHQNVDALTQHFTTYLIDFPGWGASSKNLLPAGTWGNPLEAAGKVVLGFLDALGIGSAHLMGGSFGAAAALYAAMLRPDKVEKLILMVPGGGIPAPGVPVPALVKLFGYYAGEKPSQEKFEDLARHMVYDKSLITGDWLRARYEASLDGEVMANPPLRLPPGFVPEPSQSLCRDERLKAVVAPTLFIWGRDDEVQPVSCLESFNAIPQQDALILGRCGHMPYWEHPGKVNDIATWFLRSA